MFNIRSRIAAAGMAAAIAAGTLAAVPAEAGIAQAPAVLAAGGDGPLVQDVAWKKWKKYPHYSGGGNYHHHWHGGGNNNWVGPLVGGMVIGGMLAAPYYGGYGYAPAPRYRYGSHDAYCHARFRSYNSATGFYLGYDGHYHRC
ncbi:MAG: BA14K family protein [Rhizobiales bacterium]|nr:BA14K family protein [Hyphomicrobiales bacterium]MBN9009289.1 BA14K family protein [Hyphomicrobiales bacterium]